MPISIKLLPFSLGGLEGKNELNSGRPVSVQEHRKNMAILLSEDLWLSALECFLKTAGLTTALPILRPISQEFGKLSNERRIFGAGASKLDEIISCECLLAEIMLGGSAQGEIFENGARVHPSGCKLEGRCPEICFLCCQMMGEACTKAMNPDYDHLLVESLSCGDSECGWILRKQGETSSDLGEWIQFERLAPNEREIEAVRVLLQQTYIESWKKLTEAFILALGEERAAPALENSMRSLGMAKWKEYATALGIEGSEIDSVSHLRRKIFDLLQIAGIHFPEEGRGENDIMINSFSMPPLICLQIEAFCVGALEAINPDYEPYYDKAIAVGNQSWQWPIRKRASEVMPDESYS